MEHLSSIISAIGVIIAAWFSYNQYAKNKITDLKLEKYKEESELKKSQNNRNAGKIFGLLWELRVKLDVQRVFIIQPHPENNHKFISAVFECRENGVSSVSDMFDSIPMNEVAPFVKLLASNCWLHINNIEQGIECRKTKAIMLMAGTRQIAVKQLINVHNDWIGSLVIESTDTSPFDPLSAKEQMKVAANAIQFLLPPIS